MSLPRHAQSPSRGQCNGPVLGGKDIVGSLFRQTSNTQNRSELLVMITPRVVRNSNALSGLTEQIRWAGSMRAGSY
ncbi:hypothetical protein I0K15_10090 [Pontivivens ytuae]|uniref:Type II/III secretion system secretin-like domain-containing protein n=1 Tax=Pontivivens ytuae TaxID=2789856 RepID=A0A7S9LVI8_9RHOB|nr:hypothetical protein I0K15_10090 [Pontivivens ytuae]